MENPKNSLEVELKKARKDLLNFLEATCGDNPKWKLIRSFILKVFGRDGLEQAVRDFKAREEK